MVTTILVIALLVALYQFAMLKLKCENLEFTNGELRATMHVMRVEAYDCKCKKPTYNDED